MNSGAVEGVLWDGGTVEWGQGGGQSVSIRGRGDRCTDIVCLLSTCLKSIAVL